MNTSSKLCTGILIILIIGIIIGVFVFPRGGSRGSVDYKNATYIIGGTAVTLKDGVSDIETAPGASTRIITRYFGNEAKGDLNGDGIVDLAFILTQTTGGSGTFYYVVGALQDADGGYTGTEGVLIGDRIAPQSVEIKKAQAASSGVGDQVVVNYADRAPGQSFAVAPSVAKSIWLKLDLQSMQFGQIARNDGAQGSGSGFEGEANPAMMTLTMKKWVWKSAAYKNGTTLNPIKAGAFTLIFEKIAASTSSQATPATPGRFTATTDCNSGFGSYTLSGMGTGVGISPGASANARAISFSNIATTKMFCEGSQEQVFFSLLEKSRAFHFTSKGELILELVAGEGTVIFR